MAQIRATPDPFALLGLPRTYALTPPQIQSAYLARIALVHPDASATADIDPFAPAHAAGAPIADASVLNQAKDIVLNPETRAHALLALLDPRSVSDKSLPADFLEEIMSIREAVEAAQADPANPANATTLVHARQWAFDQRQRYTIAASHHFAAGAYAPLRPLLNAWRYIERLIEQLPPA